MRQKVRNSNLYLIFWCLLFSGYTIGQTPYVEGYLVLYYGSYSNSHVIDTPKYSSIKSVYFFDNTDNVEKFIKYVHSDRNRVFIDYFGYPNPRYISFKILHSLMEIDVNLRDSIYKNLKPIIKRNAYDSLIIDSGHFVDRLLKDNLSNLKENCIKSGNKFVIFKSKLKHVVDLKTVGIFKNKYRSHGLSYTKITDFSDLVLISDENSFNKLFSIIYFPD